MGVLFDKLGFMRKLESGGEFSRAQAEKLMDAFHDAVVESVATKQDVSEVRVELREVRAEVRESRSEVQQVKSDLRAEIAQVKGWVAGTAGAVVSVLAAIKYFG
jgi:predicted  nucleic acid-binding Zn-ribbon protein